MKMVATKTLAILFSRGAFGDCAKHAVLTAMEDDRVGKIKIYSSSIAELNDPNWKCGCGIDHGAQLKDSPNAHKLERIHVKDLTCSPEQLSSEVDLRGVDAVISGIGNRQMFLGDRVAKAGTKNITILMKANDIDRLVMMSSMGVDSDVSNDWPCMEWRKEGKFMGYLFNTLSRREYSDIVGAENEAYASGVNYLTIRPVGLGEQVKPAGRCYVQKKKFEDVLGANMAKMDVGRFMVEEALEPTFHKQAVVIGADPKDAYEPFS